MRKMRVVGLGLFAVFAFVTTVGAQNPPATDGLKFAKDFPQPLKQPTGGYWISASGGLDTTKYPQAVTVHELTAG